MLELITVLIYTTLLMTLIVNKLFRQTSTKCFHALKVSLEFTKLIFLFYFIFIPKPADPFLKKASSSMARITLKEGSPVVVNGKRGLLKGRLANNRFVIDIGGAIIADGDSVKVAMCVGCVVAVKGFELLSANEFLNGRKGKVVKHRRGEMEKFLVRFGGGYEHWLRAENMRVIQSAPPRSEVGQSQCFGAAKRDWGLGLATCGRCGTWPIFNRGCSQCDTKYCSDCFAEHHLDSDSDDSSPTPYRPTRQIPDYHDPSTRPSTSCLKSGRLTTPPSAPSSPSSSSSTTLQVSFTLPNEDSFKAARQPLKSPPRPLWIEPESGDRSSWVMLNNQDKNPFN